VIDINTPLRGEETLGLFCENIRSEKCEGKGREGDGGERGYFSWWGGEGGIAWDGK
jgi:hypothetical protein